MGENILATTYGAEYIDEKNVGIENGGPNGRYPNGRSQLTSVFLQPSFESVGNFRIVPGVRYDRHSVESSDQSFTTKVDEELSSKLALVYFVNPGFSFYTSYGEAFMAPKIQELYAYGEHYSFKAGPMTVVNNFIPNPDLTSEKSVTYELGTHFKKENKVKNSFFKVEASIYETQAEDFVDFEFDKNRMGGGTTKFVNKDDVRMQGAEASIAGGYQRLEGKVSYTTIKSEDLKTNQPLDQTPGNKTKISGRVILSQKSKIKLGTSLTHYAKRDAAESGSKSELEYNEYFTQDLYINWEPKISVFERTRIGLRLNNIYDRSYLQHGTPIPGVGRDVRLNLTINL
jgi:hemoglobin/transferrin/lactoferrin receptor protein